MTLRTLSIACMCCVCVTCNQPTNKGQDRPAPTLSQPSASAQGTPRAGAASAPQLAEPMLLTELPVSAYQATLAMDDEAVFLLTQTAAYRIVPGQAPQGLKLELGIGPVLTPTSFIYWSKGSIWKTPKEGGDPVRLARFPHQPQYFASYGDLFAWIDMSDDGSYSIQTLDGTKPRVLVSSKGELAALNLVGGSAYFVERPSDGSWRPGVVKLTGGEPTYGPERKGRRPSMFTGSDATFFYEVDKNEIRKLSPDAQSEETMLREFICSPLHVSHQIYCACTEGLFAVSRDTRKPSILAGKQAGPIPFVTSNSKWVAWLVDSGRDKLSVHLLPALGTAVKTGL